MSLLVVGSVAFDALESPYGKVDRALGGAATYFAVAASFFTHVSLVAIVGNDFTSEDERIFRGRHIDTDGLERAEGNRKSTAAQNTFSSRTSLPICSATCFIKSRSGRKSPRWIP